MFKLINFVFCKYVVILNLIRVVDHFNWFLILYCFYEYVYHGMLCNHSCVCARLCFSDVAALSTPTVAHGVGESPLRSHRHSWRQQIFLRVATPQKSTETSGKRGATHKLI